VCSKWTFFAKDKIIKRKWLSMLKYVCKEHGKELISGTLKQTDEETGLKKEVLFYKINL
jgi:hypothetical protein